MKSTTIKSFFLTIVFFGMLFSAQAQKSFTVDAKSNFSVFGTSTLHDWEMKSGSGSGTANFIVADSKLTDINALTVSILTESIKSGKNAMDKIAYETLKSSKNKTLKYVLKSADKVNETTWNLTGTYTIAGVSKELKTQVKVAIVNGIVTLQGSNKITFEEFGMKSPTAMFGAIKTGQDLTIKFNINFK